MEIAAKYRMGPLFTPPSLIDDPDGTRGTLVLPGWGGGASWPGAGVDVGPRGLPLVKPPWGRITAIDLNTGDHLWMKPLGGVPREVREHPDLQGLGLDLSSMGQNCRPGSARDQDSALPG